MDRDKLKEATAGRAPRRGGRGAAQKDTRLSDALDPSPDTLTLRGKTFRLEPLDLFDFTEIEARYGNLSAFFQAIADEKMSAVQDLVWLSLRKGDPDLTPEEREACEYRLTAKQAGALITVTHGDLGDVIAKIMTASGLRAAEGNPETPAGQ